MKHIKKLIIPKNKKLLLNEIQKCAIVVYDISLDKNQIVEAKQAMQSNFQTFELVSKKLLML